jgi:hypothetical protein
MMDLARMRRRSKLYYPAAAAYDRLGGDFAGAIDDLIRLGTPDATPEGIADARDAVRRMVESKRYLAAKAGIEVTPPTTPFPEESSDVPRWCPLDPPHDRGRRVIRKAGGLGG